MLGMNFFVIFDSEFNTVLKSFRYYYKFRFRFCCLECDFLLKSLSLSHITTLKLDQKPSLSTAESQVSCVLWDHGYAEMSGQRNK